MELIPRQIGKTRVAYRLKIEKHEVAIIQKKRYHLMPVYPHEVCKAVYVSNFLLGEEVEITPAENHNLDTMHQKVQGLFQMINDMIFVESIGKGKGYPNYDSHSGRSPLARHSVPSSNVVLFQKPGLDVSNKKPGNR